MSAAPRMNEIQPNVTPRGWRVDYSRPGFVHPDQPPEPPGSEWQTEELAEYAAATVRREETRRHHW